MFEKNEDYTYPDQDESITLAMIKKHAPYEGYWEESEREIVKLIKTYMKKSPPQPKNLFFDAGCGGGRMLIEFNDYFQEGVGVDPDTKRLQYAIQNVSNRGLSEKITFENKKIEDVQLHWKADTILCSHVLQHIKTSSIQNTLNKFRDVISEQGLLFITTCHSINKDDRYSKSQSFEESFLEEWIEEEEFNSLVTNEENILPAHFFTKDSISHHLDKAGFEVLDFRVYHILDEVPGLQDPKERDAFVNQNPPLQESKGRDLFVVARPKP